MHVIRPHVIGPLLIVALSLTGCRAGEPAAGQMVTASSETGTGDGRTHWWNRAVFYEVFVRSFQDSGTDGVGDLAGLISRLDYLNDGDPETDTDLGVTGLWLMPINPSNSYHGYDVTDYRGVNPDYGTGDDFRRLMREAHARGIRVIVDLVLNHSSWKHPWFVDSASGPDSTRRAWYRWSSSRPDYKGPWGQPVWHRHAPSGMYYYGLFWHGMPDLNYEHPPVRAEMKAVAGHWLTRMGADGFRLDAIKFMHEEGPDQTVLQNGPKTHAFWREFRQHVGGVKPDAFILGEAWDKTPIAASYVGDQMDAGFEFGLAGTILDAANQGRGDILEKKLQEVMGAYPFLQYATFATNHDQARAMNQLGRDPGRARLAAAAYLTLPGIPFIYYGEEIGMLGTKPDEDIRRPMQWDGSSWAGFTRGRRPWRQPGPGHRTNTVAAQTGSPRSLLSWYRRLVRLRTGSPALTRGDCKVMRHDSKNVLALLRVHGEQRMVVLINFGEQVVKPRLSLKTSPLRPGRYGVRQVFRGNAASGEVRAAGRVAKGRGQVAELSVEGGGAISGWQPLFSIAAHGLVVVGLDRSR